MRIPHIRPRLSLKALIGLVAVAALLIWIGMLYRAAGRYRHMAEWHEMHFKRHDKTRFAYEGDLPREQEAVRWIVTEIGKRKGDPRFLKELVHQLNQVETLQKRAVFNARLADHHLWMKRKYEHAYFHPWESVEPDPQPPPEVR